MMQGGVINEIKNKEMIIMCEYSTLRQPFTKHQIYITHKNENSNFMIYKLLLLLIMILVSVIV